MSLNLDVDVVRRLIGGWQGDPHESGMLARGAAVALATAHLGAGRDVVVPQYLGRAPFIERLRAVAADVAVPFHEIVLMTSREEAIRRFVDRTRGAAEPAHLEAHKMAEMGGERDPVGAMYDRLRSLLLDRPSAAIVPTQAGQPEATYELVIQALGARE